MSRVESDAGESEKWKEKWRKSLRKRLSRRQAAVQVIVVTRRDEKGKENSSKKEKSKDWKLIVRK